MRPSSIRIQTIVNATGMHFSVIKNILDEMARVNSELTAAMNRPDYEDLDWEHTAGYIEGMRKALVMAGADGSIIDLYLKDKEDGNA